MYANTRFTAILFITNNQSNVLVGKGFHLEIKVYLYLKLSRCKVLHYLYFVNLHVTRQRNYFQNVYIIVILYGVVVNLFHNSVYWIISSIHLKYAISIWYLRYQVLIKRIAIVVHVASTEIVHVINFSPLKPQTHRKL